MARFLAWVRLRRFLRVRSWRQCLRPGCQAKKTPRSNTWLKCFRNCNAVAQAATYGCAAPPLCGKLGPVKCSDPPPRRELTLVMNWNFHRNVSFRTRYATLLWVLAGVFFVAQFSPAALASGAKEPAALPGKLGEPGAPRTSIFRSGVLETKEGLTLRLTADLGSVNIT